MITWKKAALAAAATALALAATGAVAGGIDNQGKWNPDLTEDAPRYRSYPAPAYTPPTYTRPAPEPIKDPYEDFNFGRRVLRINGEPINYLEYQGWLGTVAASGDYFFFRPHGKRKFWMMISAAPKSILDKDNHKVKSFVLLKEVDCLEGRSRTLQYSEYDDIMGVGDALNMENIKKDEWTYPLPGTVLEEWMSYFCSRR